VTLFITVSVFFRSVDGLELRAVFKVFDMDKDGYITMEEVIQVLESMGFLPSQGCIEDIFRQVDLDGQFIVTD
jgi:Ca2+-binding EF-hand superfamily protein